MDALDQKEASAWDGEYGGKQFWKHCQIEEFKTVI